MDVVKHSDLSFVDGNIAVLAGSDYFIVHQGLLVRHSPVLRDLVAAVGPAPAIDGRPVLALPDSARSIALLLQALYDGMSVPLPVSCARPHSP